MRRRPPAEPQRPWAGAPARRGAVLIEAAFVLIVLLLLTFGTIEFGFFIHYKHTLTSAARSGARAAIVAGSDATDVQDAVKAVIDPAGMQSHVDYTTSAVEIKNATTGVIVASPDDVPAGEDIGVTVKATSEWGDIGFSPMGLIASNRVVSATVVMRKEG
jgi:Flp pilus assembly protein TadG